MNRTKILLITASVLLVSLLIIIALYRSTHPLGGILTDIDASDVRTMSSSILNELEINMEGLTPDIKLKSNARLIRLTQVEFGFSRGNELLRSGIPGYYWEAEWKTGGMLTFSSGEGGTGNNLSTKARFRFDSQGNLLQFTREVNDTLITSKLSREEAEQLSQSFILNYAKGNNYQTDTLTRKITDTLQSVSFNIGSGGRVEFKNEKKIEQEKRTDYEFFYTGRDEILKNELKLTVTVSGNIISGFDTEFVIPEGEYTSEVFKIYEAVAVILFYVIIFILIAILGFRRIRAFEIGFRTAIIMGLITALFFAVEIYLSLGESIGWEVIIPLLLGPLFYGGGVLLIWAVSETVARETWNEKMISVDLLTKGYFLHSRVGTSFLTGISGGAFLAAILLILLFAADSIMPLWYTPDDNSFFNQFNSPVPALTLLTHFVYASIFVAAVFFLFIVSGLRKRFNTIWLIVISALLWGLVNAKSIYPIYAAVGIEVVVGLVLIWIFYRYDLLSALAAFAVYNLILSGGVLIYQQDVTFLNSGYFVAVFLIMLLLLSVISLFTKDTIQDFQNITPVFVKNITERQRMQRELEIARDVQMSFLPRENPDFKGLDIAGRCYPANEVGGDYYDFIKISDTKAGIIVGDVSGKGTQAAFYMTLTKGFLKAVSKVSESPSEVLSQMNELFYENVERGTFISMIYGMFDNEKKIFKLARAGHNPVIVKRSLEGEVAILNPTGLALGLEKGIIFRKTIKEVELPISLGEVYVFYTDGFTEAMDRDKTEFGEERLIKYVESNSALSAQEILDGIFTNVKKFMGKAYQHDDMTMVVVKVKDTR
jgi:phosphoserine phosphatase RsbU/P